MMIYLLSHDMVTPGLWSSTAPGPDRVRIVAGRRERPEWVFRRIRDAVRHPRSIWALRIVAHGNMSGFRTADGGLLSENFGAWVHLQNIRQTFGQLAGCFTPGGLGIELHCCNVASGRWEVHDGHPRDRSGCFDADSPGIRFVQDVADITSARVTAGISEQEVAVNGREDWRFEEAYVVVNPRTSAPASRLTTIPNPAAACAN